MYLHKRNMENKAGDFVLKFWEILFYVSLLMNYFAYSLSRKGNYNVQKKDWERYLYILLLSTNCFWLIETIYSADHCKYKPFIIIDLLQSNHFFLLEHKNQRLRKPSNVPNVC